MTRIALSLLLALGCECGSSELELDDRTADRQAEQAAAELAIEQAAEQAAAEQAIEQAATEQAATEHAATEQPTEEAGTSPGAPPLPPTAVLGDAPLCEASALVRLGRQFLVADNEVHDRLFRFGRRMEPLGIVPMPPSDHPRDLEAMAYNGQNLLLIGSHSPRADGTRRDTRHRLRLVRVVANQLVPISASETGPVETSRERCLTELFGVEPTANAQAFCDALVRAGSMNIEGATVIDGRFWVGLRSPLVGGRAVLGRLRSPTPLNFDRLLLSDLNGQGIRAMDGSSGVLHVIAGPIEDGDSPHTLFRIDAEGQAEALRELPTSSEGLSLLGPREALVVIDGAEGSDEHTCREPARWTTVRW